MVWRKPISLLPICNWLTLDHDGIPPSNNHRQNGCHIYGPALRASVSLACALIFELPSLLIIDYKITNIGLATIILHYTPISPRDHGKPSNDMHWQMWRQPADCLEIHHMGINVDLKDKCKVENWWEKEVKIINIQKELFSFILPKIVSVTEMHFPNGKWSSRIKNKTGDTERIMFHIIART